jgi:hypothetical protein
MKTLCCPGRRNARTQQQFRDLRQHSGGGDLALPPAEGLAECRALLVAAQHEQLRAVRQQGI